MPYISTATLPSHIQSILKEIDYRGKDINLEAKVDISVLGCANDGCRAFYATFSLSEGKHKVVYGSYGGANMFERHQPDHDDSMHTIPEGFGCLKGQTGHKGSFATLYVNPANVARMLPEIPEITDREKYLLACFRGLTSNGRAREWTDNPHKKPTEVELTALSSKGWLKISKNGATSITTEGKNAVGNYRVY